MESKGLVVVSSECLNCKRFMEILGKVKDHGIIVADYSSLTPAQRINIQAVPTLILNSGKRLVGTDVFTWVSEMYASSLEPSAYDMDGGDDLIFSSVNDPVGYCESSSGYANL
jgi:hypothetical protein